MSTPNPKHQDFISNLRRACKVGVSSLSDLALSTNQYSLLYTSGAIEPLTPADFVGDHADINSTDIASAIAAFSQVNSILAASGNAGWIAAYKLGR